MLIAFEATRRGLALRWFHCHTQCASKEQVGPYDSPMTMRIFLHEVRHTDGSIVQLEQVVSERHAAQLTSFNLDRVAVVKLDDGTYRNTSTGEVYTEL